MSSVIAGNLIREILRREPLPNEAEAYAVELQQGLTTSALTSRLILGSNPAAPSGEAIDIVFPILRFYQGVYGRVPDQGGLTYWVGVYRSIAGQDNPGTPTQNEALVALARPFVDPILTVEFANRYGPAPTSFSGPAWNAYVSNFIDKLYLNVLQRAADSGGLAYWVGQFEAKFQELRTAFLANGRSEAEAALETRAIYLEQFTNSPEMIASSQAWIVNFLTGAAQDPDPADLYTGSLFNDGPIVGPAESYQVTEDVELSVGLANGLLANDRDVDFGQSLSAVLLTGPSKGTLSLDAQGTFRYTPFANATGADTFIYRVNDGYDFSGGVTVSLAISPVADPPSWSVAANDSAAVTLTETNGALAASRTLTLRDPDQPSTVNVSVLSVAASGTAPLQARPTNAALLSMLTLSPSTVNSPQGIDQTVTWSFASGAVNFDNLALAETLVLTYALRAHDGALSGQQAVTVTIEGSNDAPVISIKVGDSASAALVEADAGLQISDTLTFGDVDLSDQLTLSVVSVAASGIGNGSALPSATALLAMLEFDKVQALVGTGGVEEQVVWRFNSGTEAFNFLNPGETLSLAYTVQASDGRVSDQEVITIQIAGTADEVLRLISTSTGSRPAATPHTLITGESTSDRAGSSLIGIGDFNGDGIDDMVVGAPGDVQGGANGGAAFIVFGAPSRAQNISLSDIANGIGGRKIVSGLGSEMGFSLAAAGDVNGDGLQDLLIGGPRTALGGAGDIYVVYGRPNDAGPTQGQIDLASVNGGSAGFRMTAESPTDVGFGQSAAGGGDFNGDGHMDLLVGSGGNDAQGVNSGAAYLVFGTSANRPNVSLSNVALGQGGLKIIGETGDDQTGLAVAFAGDFNNDGLDDLLIGSTGQDQGGSMSGATYLVYGHANPASSINLVQIAAGTGGFKITGENAGDRAGTRVAGLGDINNDGFDDLFISAPFNAGAGTQSGAAYVVFGRAQNPGALNLDNVALGQGGFKLLGEGSFDQAGTSIQLAGDVNADGLPDLLVGATNENSSYVVFGRETWPASISLRDISNGIGGFRILGNSGEGASIVAPVGDVDQDGIDDIAIGTPGASTAGAQSGGALLIFGGSRVGQMPPSTIDTRALLARDDGYRLVNEIGASGAQDFAGKSVALADFNGDGYADVLVGAYLDDVGGDGSGSVYVSLGGPTRTTDVNLNGTVTGTGGFRIVGETGGDQAGFSVAAAGDINNDGFEDIVIGAPGNDAGGSNAGAAYLVYGRLGPTAAIDLDAIASGVGGFKLQGPGPSQEAGSSVAGVGDFNNDGYDDFLVGAGGFNFLNPTPQDTAAFLIYGGPTRSSTINLAVPPVGVVSIIAETAGDGSGFSVAGGGDINGDGFADLIIGAPDADPGGIDSGAIYVVFGGALSGTINLGTVAGGGGGFKIIGQAPDDYAGTSVASAGDFNNDGFDDILIGAPENNSAGGDSGTAYLIFGKATPFGTIDLDTIAGGSGGFRIVAELGSDYLGAAVHGAGDVNGDGFDDLIVGAPDHDIGGNNSGAGYVIFGRAQVPTAILLDDVAAGIGGARILGERGGDGVSLFSDWGGDGLGFAVSGGADVNNDGLSDVVLGSPYSDAFGENGGAAHLIYGWVLV